MITVRLLLVALVAVLSLGSLHTAALPMHHLGRKHHIHALSRRNVTHSHQQQQRRSDDHGDVAAHDAYEAQLHALEAALHHYEQYGDAQSLQTYLQGFGTNSAQVQKPSNDASATAGDAKSGAGTPAKSGSSGTNSDESKKEGEEDCTNGSDETKPVQPVKMPSQNQPKMQKQPKKSQPKKQDYTAPKPQPQPQVQPQPQPKPQPEQPKSQPKPQPAQPISPPEGYDPNAGAHHSDSGNSINGYTPPAFSTSSAPSVASLYTSAPFIGRATFYNTGLGACGIVNADNDPIVAVSRDVFERFNPASGNPNHNSLCGRKVEIHWHGKTTQAFAIDECPSCQGTSLDMSPSVFQRLDSKDKGVLDGITWQFV